MKTETSREKPKRFARVDLGQAMVRIGRVTAEQLAGAQRAAQANSLSIEDALVAQGLLTQEEVRFVLARALGLPYMNVQARMADPRVVALFPPEVLWRYRALPLTRDAEGILVAIADPYRDRALGDVQAIAPAPVRFALALEAQIEDALRRLLERTPMGAMIARLRTETESAGDPSGVVFVYGMLVKAVRLGAEEVSLAAAPERVTVEYRAFGCLQEREEHPGSLALAAFTRLRILTGLTGEEGTEAGHVRTRIGGEEMELAVRFGTTGAGGIATVRLLRPGETPADLARWPLPAEEAATVTALAEAPRGVVLVGAADAALARPFLRALAAAAAARGGRKAFTVEMRGAHGAGDGGGSDGGGGRRAEGPRGAVGGVLPYVATETGLPGSGAGALREALAHRPGILVVDGVQSEEELGVLLEAAQGDLLVLLGAPVASGARCVQHLLARGAARVLLAEALVGVIALRSLPRLCLGCRQARPGGGGYRRTGCAACGRTGYRGRVLACEAATCTAAVRDAIADGGSSRALGEALRAAGGVPLEARIARLAAEGVTDERR
ncbi:MAG: hypothetical protein HZA54_08525 [Planctomycetes bacterium]|nr:hypothetical protein [Planctomycetota bacterium]